MRREVLFMCALALLIVSGGFLSSQPSLKDRAKRSTEAQRRVLSTVALEMTNGLTNNNAGVNQTPSYVYFTNHALDGDPVYGAKGTQSKMNNFASFRFTVVAGPNGQPTLKAGSGMYHSDDKGICHELGQYIGVLNGAPPSNAPFYVFQEKNNSQIRWAFEATPDDPDFCTILRQQGKTGPLELYQVAVRRPLVEQ
jgi:hypothetical protein